LRTGLALAIWGSLSVMGGWTKLYLLQGRTSVK
jgi:hypothetical protein